MGDVGAAQDSQIEPRRACHECNRKKTKCDMRRPVCGLCSRTGSSCHFPSKRKKPTPRNPQSKPYASRLSDGISKLIQGLQAASEARQGRGSDDAGTRDPHTLLHETLQTLLAEVGSSEDRQFEECSVSRGRNGYSESIEDDPNDTDVHTNEQYLEAQPSHEPSGIQTTSTTLSIDPDTGGGIPCSVAADLINLFFAKVQPWLPILHRPRFQARYEDKTLAGGDFMQGLSSDESLLFYSMFAMAARFSSDQRFARVPPNQRGHQFAERARQIHAEARMLRSSSLTYLQGCILLAFYYYTSGPTQQGWILIRVCVGLAYELGLNEIDDIDWTPAHPVDAVEKEEMRRAWWLVWELDTFASCISRKPYSIDRKRMTVALPISDEAWFSGINVPSAQLVLHPGHSWTSLQGSPNQDERAWFLLANHFMATVHDRLQQKQDISPDEKLTLENEVCCFRLALPSSLQLDAENLDFSPSTFARCNWAIGTHLMLMATSFMVAGIVTSESDGHSVSSIHTDAIGPLRQRAIDLSRIISVWDPKYIAVAHPFYTCMMLAPFAGDGHVLRSQPLLSSTHDMAKLVLRRFSEKWKLGSVVAGKEVGSLAPCSWTDIGTLEISEYIERSGPLTAEEKQLVKRYAIFFRIPRSNNSSSPTSNIIGVNQRERSSPEMSEQLPYTVPLDIQVPTVTQEGFASSLGVPASATGVNHQTAMFHTQELTNYHQPNAYDGVSNIDFGFADFFGGSTDSDFMLG